MVQRHAETLLHSPADDGLGFSVLKHSRQSHHQPRDVQQTPTWRKKNVVVVKFNDYCGTSVIQSSYCSSSSTEQVNIIDC